MSSTQEDAITATYNLVTNLLPALQDAYKIRSANLQHYNDLRTQFLNQLLLANSGKVVSDKELQRYQSLLPSTYSNTLFTFGRNGDTQLNDILNNLKGTLNNSLSSNGLSIYGYSTVKVGNQEYKVGDVVVNSEGQSGRVNPDGTVTIINE